MIPMTIPRRKPIKNLDRQKPIFLFNLAASKSYLSNTTEEFVKDFIQDHDDWVHHVVHVSRCHR